MKKKYRKIIVRNSPLLIVLSLVLLSLLIVYSQSTDTLKLPSRAEPPAAINADGLSEDSIVVEGDTSAKITLYTEEEGSALYETDNAGLEGILELLQEEPIIPSDVQDARGSEGIKGAFSGGGNDDRRLTLDPENFVLTKKFDDSNDEILLKQNIRSQMTHYLLEQWIKEIPVAFATLGIHQEDRKITALFANIVTDETVPEAQLTLEEAESLALVEAGRRAGEGTALRASSSLVIYNGSITGSLEDDSNHIAAQVRVVSDTTPVEFNTEYIVDLQTGEILFIQDHIINAKRRQIYNCAQAQCPLVRDDVSRTQATGDREVDQSYDILGDVYDYFFNTFGRDGMDSRGGPMKGYVHFPGSSQIRCPNAAWTGREMIACSGMVARDVWAHEFTHAVTENTAGLGYRDQYGSLNESMSDIFGYALDPEDWQMGEELTHPRVPKPIRYMDDPPRRGDPDRLFSPNYYCNERNQNTLVHTNSGVLNKAFYLMTAGDTFNGCTIRGITKEKSLAVIYQALTKPGYLTRTSNFKDAYDVIVRACTDLAQAQGSSITTDDCNQVKAALQAVEMDQQPAQGQKSPVCPGVSGQRREPACAGVQPPTATQGPTQAPTVPEPTSPQPLTPTPTTGVEPTSTPPQLPKLKSVTFEQKCTAPTIENSSRFARYECTDASRGRVGDGQCRPNSELRALAVEACEPVAELTTTPEPTLPEPTVPQPTTHEPTPTESVPTTPPEVTLTVNLKLKFQGIRRKPADDFNSMPVECSIGDGGLTQSVSSTATFTADDAGIWTGTLNYTSVQPGSGYKMVCKGKKYHLAKKVCDQTPTEEFPGSYSCDKGKIVLTADTDLDFSGVIMLVGDVGPVQDGWVTAYDISSVRNNFGSTDEHALEVCDMNLDGACNTIDHALMIESLTVKSDEK